MKVKTIYLMILAVILITFCLVMYSAFSNITARTDSDSLEQQPMIVIDAGHGGNDPGALVFSPSVWDPALIAELTCAGSVMIIALGLNLLGITKLKVANFLPALLLVPLFYKLWMLLPI